MSGTEIDEKAKLKDLEESEAKLAKKRMIGYILIVIWLIGSGYAIAMFAISFSSVALQKWLLAFFASFGYDVIIVFNMKMFLKVFIGLLLMSVARFPIMMTIAGSIASKIVDTVMHIS